jgi:hypothetical protein
MKRSSQLLLEFVAALRAEGGDLPESDFNTVSTLSDVIDSYVCDELNFPEHTRTVETLWIAVNATLGH